MNTCPWCKLEKDHKYIRDTNELTEYQCVSCNGKFVKMKGTPVQPKEVPSGIQQDNANPLGSFQKFETSNKLARKSKGKKWAMSVLWLILITQGIKILFAFGHANPAKPISEAIAAIIGLTIIMCPIAFAIGYFTGKSD